MPAPFCSRKTPNKLRAITGLAIATSLWANKFTSPLRRNFGRTIADLHGKAAEVDFESSEAKALMSSWLSKNTSGKFTSAPEMDADTVFAIISALYFKDSWVDPLDDEDVEVVFRAPEPQSDVAMMGGFGSYGHLLSTRETTAVSWPMQSGAVAVFARSNNGATLDDFVQSGAAWDAILRCHMRMGTTRPKGGIELFVPQFELRSDDRDLGGMLRSLGIEKIFSPGADFGNITEADAMVSRVVQNAVLKLDPNGAEGAAYTIFAVPAGCAPESMPGTREGRLRPPVRVRHLLAFRCAIVCWGIWRRLMNRLAASRALTKCCDVVGCAIGLPFGPKHFKFFHKAVEFLDCKMRYLTCRIGMSLAGVRLARYVPRLFY